MEIEERFQRIERTMEFLVQQQADLNGFLIRLARFSEDFTRKTEERFEHIEDAHQRLEEAQRKTDERLNVLIGIVGRYFENGGRRGNS
ncbi:MAG: hypothetical protein HY644_13620 [Acidobacteria bacterium]|nr:hypothetical protein [Acidobacteriota bacterium]